MPRPTGAPCRWRLAGPLLLAFACTHDAPRDNPLDPQLTPPVSLQVALNDTSGTVALMWTRYEGGGGFRGEHLRGRRGVHPGGRRGEPADTEVQAVMADW